MFKNTDVQKFYNHKFDFSKQYKEDYGDWLMAFDKAVSKRATNDCFVAISSGYDSGVILHRLSQSVERFKAYTICYNENKEVLDQRLKEIKDYQIVELSEEAWEKYYPFVSNLMPGSKSMAGTIGTALIFELAKNEGRTVFFSGQGGDEILSDYALWPECTTFKGTYPKDLFEWENFKEGKNRVYINLNEELAKLYGIEVKYPLLDVDLVQEFLWLRPELKNKNYKAPLFEYLTLNNIPFEKGCKRGFSPSNKEVAYRHWSLEWPPKIIFYK